jgi:hypothetical protein
MSKPKLYAAYKDVLLSMRVKHINTCKACKDRVEIKL